MESDVGGDDVRVEPVEINEGRNGVSSARSRTKERGHRKGGEGGGERKDEHGEQDPASLSLVGTLLLLVNLGWGDEIRVRGRRYDWDDGDGRGGSRDGRDDSLLNGRVGSSSSGRDRSRSGQRGGSSSRRDRVRLEGIAKGREGG